MPFETFVWVCLRSRSHILSNDKMVINLACLGHNFYIYGFQNKLAQLFSLRSRSAI